MYICVCVGVCVCVPACVCSEEIVGVVCEVC